MPHVYCRPLDTHGSRHVDQLLHRLRILDPSLFHRNICYRHLPLLNLRPIIRLPENERPAGGHNRNENEERMYSKAVQNHGAWFRPFLLSSNLLIVSLIRSALIDSKSAACEQECHEVCPFVPERGLQF